MPTWTLSEMEGAFRRAWGSADRRPGGLELGLS
jgi:hypothetical protein